MIAKIKVAEAIENPTKNGETFLKVKSSTGGYAKIWKDNQYLWHLFIPGAELEVGYTKDQYGVVITGVVGVQPPNPSGGVTVASNKPVSTGMPSSWDLLFKKLNEIEKKIDDLAANYGMEPNPKLPPLDNDITPSDIPF